MLSMDHPNDVKAKLSHLTPAIDDVRQAGATLGLSVGVISNGQVIYSRHFGQRELAKPDPPDSETMYFVSSLTKAVTTEAVGILCKQGHFDWGQPMVKYVPELTLRGDTVGREATLVDFLCHRTGLAKVSAYWAQRKQRFMMPKQETVRTVINLKSAVPFRGSFLYNNWGYGLVEVAIERATGRSYPDFVQNHIFEPLHLKRTTFKPLEGPNIASANTNRDNGAIVALKMPPQSDQTGLAGAGAMKASLSDLLQLYAHFLQDYTEEEVDQSVQHFNPLFQPQIPIGNVDMNEHSYTMGLVRSTLPRRLGTTSMNAVYLGADNMPVIGNQSPGTIVYHHHGNLLGTSACVYMIPEIMTAVVVLTNTLGFSDTADWVGQLVLQTLINETPHDYIEWTRKAKAALLQQYTELAKKLEDGRTGQPPSKDLRAYCGRYLNNAGNFALEITEKGGQSGLQMKIQDFDDVIYELLPYAGDVFYWPCDREQEMCDQVMFPWTWEEVHKIAFELSSDGSVVNGLRWGLDPTIDPLLFTRV